MTDQWESEGNCITHYCYWVSANADFSELGSPPCPYYTNEPLIMCWNLQPVSVMSPPWLRPTAVWDLSVTPLQSWPSLASSFQPWSWDCSLNGNATPPPNGSLPYVLRQGLSYSIYLDLQLAMTTEKIPAMDCSCYWCHWFSMAYWDPVKDSSNESTS